MKQGHSEKKGDRRGPPLSPCILICTLDDDKVCLGCQRTLAEISAWSMMTPEEQWQLIDELAVRKATNDATIQPLQGD